MKKVSIAEYESDMADFVVYMLRKAGYDAEKQPLIHSAKEDISMRMGKEWFKGWNPNYSVVVPKSQQKGAEKILHELSEFNWYEKKPKTVDPTRDVYPQLYGIKPFKSKRRKRKK